MAIVMGLANPGLARQIQMGILMDTRPQAFDALEAHRRYPTIPLTRLDDVVKRDYPDALGVPHGSPSDAHA
jgi:hypothetical protein